MSNARYRDLRLVSIHCIFTFLSLWWAQIEAGILLAPAFLSCAMSNIECPAEPASFQLDHDRDKWDLNIGLFQRPVIL